MITAKVKRMGLFWTVVVTNGVWQTASIEQLAKRLEISGEQIIEILRSQGAILTVVQNMEIMGWWEKVDAEKVLPYFDHLILMASMVNGEEDY